MPPKFFQLWEELHRGHSCPEALVRIKKIAKTETYTGSLYDTWGVLNCVFPMLN